MIRSGLPYLHTVYLSEAAAASFVVSNTLLDEDGATLHQWTQTVPEDSVSFEILVPAIHNTLSVGTYLTSRDLIWSYLNIVEEHRYSVEARPPFGASPEGVRAKLGVIPAELPNSDISLIKAFVRFQGVVGETAVSTVTDQQGRLAVRDAIEALAGLAVIHTMTVRVAASEDSGTNAFRRQETNWEKVAEHLDGIVLLGYLAANPSYTVSNVTGSMFLVVTPDEDPVTGDPYPA